ncbi:MAG: phosphonoacetaldehyde reductase [Pirellulales bacterium]|nr:phosphonoacetaldehyde reductase [Pirellulales bacterium]
MTDNENETLPHNDRLPQYILFGEGAIGRIGEVLDAMAVESVLVVADRHAYHLSGAEAAIEPVLSKRKHEIFSDFQENPSLENIEAGIARLKDGRHDAILAVGGGSAIDAAKAIAACSAQEASARAVITGQAPLDRPGLPTIAVPTTAGTGAQVTHFSAVFIEGRKYSLAHHTLRPTAAIVDPNLTFSMPPRVTASTGLDALCQAIESMWAVGSTNESRQFARQAIRLALTHLESAVSCPTPENRRAMCEASHLAGLAIDISMTTAAHAMAYALTIDYGVPHGMAVALTLAPLLEFNSAVSSADCMDPRGPEHVRGVIEEVVNLFGCHTPEDAGARFVDLLQAIDCPTRLSQVGLTSDQQQQTLASGVNAARLANNPRQLTTDRINQLLASIR